MDPDAAVDVMRDATQDAETLLWSAQGKVL